MFNAYIILDTFHNVIKQYRDINSNLKHSLLNSSVTPSCTTEQCSHVLAQDQEFSGKSAKQDRHYNLDRLVLFQCWVSINFKGVKSYTTEAAGTKHCRAITGWELEALRNISLKENKRGSTELTQLHTANQGKLPTKSLSSLTDKDQSVHIDLKCPADYRKLPYIQNSEPEI